VADRFCDCFWANGRNEFDPDDCDFFPNARPVYYMHGALHLIVEGSGVTRKLTKAGQTLLDQFGKPIANDPEARPLLITEASARDKVRAIEGNYDFNQSICIKCPRPVGRMAGAHACLQNLLAAVPL
jgi:hypothetical protein